MLGEMQRFGEWLPDLPYYMNPGLVEANNVIPVDGSYKDFLEFLPTGDALTERPQGAFAAINTAGDTELYIGTETTLQQRTGTTWTDRSGTAYATPSNGYWRFVQFDELVIGTNYVDQPQSKEVGSASNFADLALVGTAPTAKQIGVVNRFVVVGDTEDGTNGAVSYRIQWPAIDDPTDWPTIGTADARSKQSGEQFLPATYGAVTAIAGGQFFGLVFQQRAITRMTYVGGDVVFQFELIDKERGCWAPQSMLQVGNRVYFLSSDGWYMTDGQTVVPIGTGKVDKTFYSDFDQSYRERLTSSLDLVNKVIFWAYPSSSATEGVPDKVICYNFLENRWAHADQAVQMVFSSYTQGYTLEQLDALFTSIDDMTISLDSSFWSGGIPVVMGFAGDELGTFSGSALVARFETGEVEIQPPGFVYINGVKPLVTGDPTLITVAISTRSSQDNAARSFGSATARTTRTGVCDFRAHGRYGSARIDITGGFDRALGIQFEGVAGDGV
jgi:hypothetical protein